MTLRGFVWDLWQRVNKIFREWTEKGILGMQSDRYLIYDMSALQRELTVEES